MLYNHELKSIINHVIYKYSLFLLIYHRNILFHCVFFYFKFKNFDNINYFRNEMKLHCVIETHQNIFFWKKKSFWTLRHVSNFDDLNRLICSKILYRFFDISKNVERVEKWKFSNHMQWLNFFNCRASRMSITFINFKSMDDFRTIWFVDKYQSFYTQIQFDWCNAINNIAIKLSIFKKIVKCEIENILRRFAIV